jgi:hypothetical protein
MFIRPTVRTEREWCLDGHQKFEKFQNSFLDTETVDRPEAQDYRLDTHARDSEFELKKDL